jgi:hypothetical protein
MGYEGNNVKDNVKLCCNIMRNYEALNGNIRSKP